MSNIRIKLNTMKRTLKMRDFHFEIKETLENEQRTKKTEKTNKLSALFHEHPEIHLVKCQFSMRKRMGDAIFGNHQR